MRKVLFTLVFFMMAAGMSAHRISEQVAHQVAKNYLSVSPDSKRINKNKAASLSKTGLQPALRRLPMQESPLFYVFENETGEGWILISATDAARPVLAFSNTGRFLTDNMPENVQEWISNINSQLQYAEKNIQPSADVKAEWEAMRQGRKTADDAAIVVNALVYSQWDQTTPYNDLCPGEGDTKALTGCVATAMAQVMNYWQWPKRGTGSHSYTAYQNGYGVQTANFGNTTYDWANMLDEYPVIWSVNDQGQIVSSLDTTCTEDKAKAVATLLYHCGVAVDMDYGTDGSAASIDNAKTAFSTYFGYKTCQSSSGKQINILQQELNNGRPVLYCGENNYDSSKSHAFICDGYREDNYFHFNFGWGGSSDGWYTLDLILSDKENFSSNHYIVYGIEPNNEEYVNQLKNSTFIDYNVKNVTLLSGPDNRSLIDKSNGFTATFKSNSPINGLNARNTQVEVLVDGKEVSDYCSFTDGLLTITIPAEKLPRRLQITVKTIPDFKCGDYGLCVWKRINGIAYWDLRIYGSLSNVELLIPANSKLGMNGEHQIAHNQHVWAEKYMGYRPIGVDSVDGTGGNITLQWKDTIEYVGINYYEYYVYHIEAEWVVDNGNRYVIDDDIPLAMRYEDDDCYYERGQWYPATDIYSRLQEEKLDYEFVKVTTEPADWSGTYLLVCEDANVVFDASSNSYQSYNFFGVDIDSSSFAERIIATPSLEKAVITIEKPDYSDDYIIYRGTDDLFYNGASIGLNNGNVVIGSNYSDYKLCFNNSFDLLGFNSLDSENKDGLIQGSPLPIQLYKKSGEIVLDVSSVKAEYYSNFSKQGAYDWWLTLANYTYLTDFDYDVQMVLELTSLHENGIAGNYSTDTNIEVSSAELILVIDGVKTYIAAESVTAEVEYAFKSEQGDLFYLIVVNFVGQNKKTYVINTLCVVEAIDAIKDTPKTMSDDTGESGVEAIEQDNRVLHIYDVQGREWNMDADLPAGVYIIKTNKTIRKFFVK